MARDRFLEDLTDTPEKRVRLYTWLLTAQIISVILIVIGGVVFILWALGVI